MSELDKLISMAPIEIEELIDRKLNHNETIESEIHFIKSNLNDCLDKIYNDKSLTDEEKLIELNNISLSILELRRVRYSDFGDYII